MIDKDVTRVTDRPWPATQLPETAPGTPGRERAVTHADVALAGSSMPIDTLVGLAGLAVQAPIVLATLVHDATHQLLLGAYGVDWPSGSRVAPLQFSLCGRVIATGLPVIVTDAGTDPRVRPGSGPGVRDAEVAAYAGFPLRDAEGHAVGAVCVVDRRPRAWDPRELRIIDQTTQMVAAALADESARLAARARQDADASEAFLHALLNSLDTGVVACDTDGRLVVSNRSLRDAAGFDPDGIDPDDWAGRFEVRRPDGSPMPVEEMPLWRALLGEQTRGVEQLLGPRRRQVMVNGHPIIGPDGRRLGAVAAVHDVTARRRAERLQACELQISYALADATNTSAAGQAVLRIVGEAFSWAHGELWLINGQADAPHCTARWDRDRQPDRPHHITGSAGLARAAWRTGRTIWHPDPQRVTAALTDPREPGRDEAHARPAAQLQAALALPLRCGERAVGVLTFFADTPHDPDDPVVGLLSGIAAHLGQYLERRRAEDLELALARSKDEYIALVGHELRTPLTSIASYTDLIDEHPDGTDIAEVRPLLKVLQRNTTALRRTIDDLLDLAAIDAGHLTLHPQPIDLSRLLRDAVTAITTAPTAGITVHTDIAEHLTVDADPHRLRQVVDNLLSNAVKYSPDGGRITITARPATSTDHPLAGDLAGAGAGNQHTGRDTDAVAVTITDTGIGIGIPDDEQQRLFQRFYRSSRARHHGIPGTGLGLAISRTIIERHHGTLQVHNSASGPGTTAIFHLPTTGSEYR